MQITKPYVREKHKTWWLENPTNLRYITREFSSFFLGSYCLVFIAWVVALALGEASYQAFIDFISYRVVTIFVGLTLLFALWHSVTWFMLAPRAMPLYLGTYKVPDYFILTMHYAAFIVISASMLLLTVWK